MWCVATTHRHYHYRYAVLAWTGDVRMQCLSTSQPHEPAALVIKRILLASYVQSYSRTVLSIHSIQFNSTQFNSTQAIRRLARLHTAPGKVQNVQHFKSSNPQNPQSHQSSHQKHSRGILIALYRKQNKQTDQNCVPQVMGKKHSQFSQSDRQHMCTAVQRQA